MFGDACSGYGVSHSDLAEVKKQISKLEEDIKKLTDRIEHETRVKMAEKEYEVMERLREAYKPPKIPPYYYKKGNDKCDFTIIGDKFICSNCHFEFEDINGYYPPYCPSCFAKVEEV